MKKNIMNLAAIGSLPLLLASTSSFAATPKPVATITQLEGRVLIEDQAGIRRIAKPNAPLLEGEHVLVLEKAYADLQYSSNDCQIQHNSNTLLKIQAAKPCATGQSIAVGQSDPIVSDLADNALTSTEDTFKAFTDTLTEIGTNMGATGTTATTVGGVVVAGGAALFADTLNIIDLGIINDEDDEGEIKQNPASP